MSISLCLSLVRPDKQRKKTQKRRQSQSGRTRLLASPDNNALHSVYSLVGISNRRLSYYYRSDGMQWADFCVIWVESCEKPSEQSRQAMAAWLTSYAPQTGSNLLLFVFTLLISFHFLQYSNI